MSIDIDRLPSSADESTFFFKNPTHFFQIQTGFVPPTVLQRLTKTEWGQQAYIEGWTKFLLMLGKNPQWRLSGENSPEDFCQNMLMGVISAKNMMTQSQGGIVHAVNTYDPTRDNKRPTICPDCGSSFWSFEHGNTLGCFKDWEVPEYRTNRNECRPPVRHSGVKVCSHIISGPYPTETEAQVAANGKKIANIASIGWVVVCGHVIDLMGFQPYVLQYIMRPLRAESRRYINAKTKGRSNNTQAYSCSQCGKVNEIDDDLLPDETEGHLVECNYCGQPAEYEKLSIFTREKALISLDLPLSQGDDKAGSIGDVIPTNSPQDQEITQITLQIQECMSSIMSNLNQIVEKRVAAYELKLKEREQTKIKQLERALVKAMMKHDHSKVSETKEKLESEKENLITDRNRIDYTRSLPEMYRLHYFGDENGETMDYRQLSEKYMFKSLPYTECNACSCKMFELNETGKIKKDYQQARVDLRATILSGGTLDGYDEHLEAIRNPDIPVCDLLPNLGKYFHCTKCSSVDITYYRAGSKNPKEPRVEITPHIFQPAQRELSDLNKDIFTYKLKCPQCANENIIRPDRLTGELSELKTSKRIVENDDGTCSAIREQIVHTCSKCNHVLNVKEDAITTSKEKNMYELVQRMSDLVEERRALQMNRQNYGISERALNRLESATNFNV